MRDHKRTRREAHALLFYTRRAFVHTARPFPSFRDIILARTLSTFRISVNMYMFTHSLALSLSRYRRVDTDQSWTSPSRTTTRRTNRRRYLILCCNVKCNTKCLHFFLSFEARIECSRWCSSHFSSSREQQQFCSFPSRRVAFRTREVFIVVATT